MRIWYSTFKGYWVGGSSVVIAEGPTRAAKMLNKELENRGIPEDPPLTKDDMIEIKPDHRNVVILDDGDT